MLIAAIAAFGSAGLMLISFTSPVIMGSPVRRLLNPITHCRDQPRNAMQGQTTDEAPATSLTQTDSR